MAETLKSMFDAAVVRVIARELEVAHPSFDEAAFVRDGVRGLDSHELLARGWHVAEAMRRHLPEPFARACQIIVRSLGAELPRTEGIGASPWRYMPHVFFVAKYGLDDFEPSMTALYELTKRFTAEFSIRPFLVKYPRETLARLERWASDPSVHVRRLVSEGSRPRLPWAQRLRAFEEDPAPVLRLLERLKDDPERYVQRSVANSLNDVTKDHPDLVVDVCKRWLEGPTSGRAWIVRHALRSLVKAGHRGALRLLGAGRPPRVDVELEQVTPKRVRVGDVARFSFRLTSAGRTNQDLLVDYAVHFVKSDGKVRPKVFKLRRLTLAPGEMRRLAGKISFEALTTRRCYPGPHRIELLVNGVALPLCTLQLGPG